MLYSNAHGKGFYPFSAKDWDKTATYGGIVYSNCIIDSYSVKGYSRCNTEFTPSKQMQVWYGYYWDKNMWQIGVWLDGCSTCPDTAAVGCSVTLTCGN